LAASFAECGDEEEAEHAASAAATAATWTCPVCRLVFAKICSHNFPMKLAQAANKALGLTGDACVKLQGKQARCAQLTPTGKLSYQQHNKPLLGAYYALPRE